jgi:uncharacterized LabA/DUF88 family protein
MPAEPESKRVCAFFDGQNLFHAAERAFGYSFLTCDPLKLAGCLCSRRVGWSLTSTRFYTGIPSAEYDPALRGFWNAKLAYMGRQGILNYSRDLKYTDIKFEDSSGKTQVFHQPREKGVDIRLAIEAVMLAHQNQYDVALIFSQDQDFTEIVKELHRIEVLKSRWIRVAGAYLPDGQDPLHGAIPIEIDRATYDACVDQRDYRSAMAKAERVAIEAGIYHPNKLPFNPPRFAAELQKSSDR